MACRKRGVTAISRAGSPLATGFPPFRLADLRGEQVALEDLRGRRVLLVHWSTGCGFCRQIAGELARLQGDLRRRKTDLVLVSCGDVESNRALLEEYRLDCAVLLQPEGATIEGFARMGTPVAYLLDEKGRVAKPVAVGADAVPELAREAAGRRRRLGSERPLAESRIEREGLSAGTPAPAFELPDLAGRKVSPRSIWGAVFSSFSATRNAGRATCSFPIWRVCIASTGTTASRS